MKGNEFLIDSDVLIDHLYYEEEGESVLEQLMSKGVCFTTVINAAELIFRIPNKKLVLDVLNAIKVLGIHPKYSLNVDKYSDKVTDPCEALFCAAAEVNKLPIVSFNREKYISTGLKIIHPKDL